MNGHRPRALRRIGDTTSYDVDSWRAQAACRDYDPEAWFPVARPGMGVKGARLVAADVENAKSVCAKCDVRTPCLAAAIERDERYGIWGGMTTEERDALKRRATA